jgi:hypothetical protein
MRGEIEKIILKKNLEEKLVIKEVGQIWNHIKMKGQLWIIDSSTQIWRRWERKGK